MTEIRARVDAIVEDPKTAEALKPWYRQLCKRPCFHDEYLQAYNRPNVHLVDTDGKGVERIDATGVWVGGVHYELDCLIFASGFEVGTEYARRAGLRDDGPRRPDALGALGRRHAEPARHPRARLPEPVHRRAWPGRQPDLEHHAQPDRGRHDDRRHRRARARHRRRPRSRSPRGRRAGVGGAAREQRRGFLGNPDCTPGYYNNEGKPMGRRERLNVSGYPHGPVAYFQYIDEWRIGPLRGPVFRAKPRRRRPSGPERPPSYHCRAGLVHAPPITTARRPDARVVLDHLRDALALDAHAAVRRGIPRDAGKVVQRDATAPDEPRDVGRARVAGEPRCEPLDVVRALGRALGAGALAGRRQVAVQARDTRAGRRPVRTGLLARRPAAPSSAASSSDRGRRG